MKSFLLFSSGRPKWPDSQPSLLSVSLFLCVKHFKHSAAIKSVLIPPISVICESIHCKQCEQSFPHASWIFVSFCLRGSSIASAAPQSNQKSYILNQTSLFSSLSCPQTQSTCLSVSLFPTTAHRSKKITGSGSSSPFSPASGSVPWLAQPT